MGTDAKELSSKLNISTCRSALEFQHAACYVGMWLKVRLKVLGFDREASARNYIKDSQMNLKLIIKTMIQRDLEAYTNYTLYTHCSVLVIHISGYSISLSNKIT